MVPAFNLRPKERFTTRVDAYVRYRPTYPQAVVDSLIRKFPADSPVSLSVADVGSGTGIFSRLLLEHGFTVYGVEPNAAMRQQAEVSLAAYAGFSSVAGEATRTTLPDRSMNVVAVAQAFHWFAVPEAVEEFGRILKNSGLALLMWNDRRTNVDAFHEGYESLLVRYCPEYPVVNHRKVTLQRICDLFPGWKISVEHFENEQRVNFEGLRGRFESSSYCPLPDARAYAPLMDQLRQLFGKYSRNGAITLRHDCVAYYAILL